MEGPGADLPFCPQNARSLSLNSEVVEEVLDLFVLGGIGHANKSVDGEGYSLAEVEELLNESSPTLTGAPHPSDAGSTPCPVIPPLLPAGPADMAEAGALPVHLEAQTEYLVSASVEETAAAAAPRTSAASASSSSSQLDLRDRPPLVGASQPKQHRRDPIPSGARAVRLPRSASSALSWHSLPHASK